MAAEGSGGGLVVAARAGEVNGSGVAAGAADADEAAGVEVAAGVGSVTIAATGFVIVSGFPPHPTQVAAATAKRAQSARRRMSMLRSMHPHGQRVSPMNALSLSGAIDPMLCG
jgi:hypothetical protein